ncbi:MAG: gamma-glutamylcyclotransferase family protein [Oleiphilaceae bacterium]|nr:gamma-glutamylcyclotransferase family protein [Oleiphilaceae bacterium]
MQDDDIHRVAVYGTLKRGHSNHHLLAGARLLGLDRLRGFRLYHLGPYPALVEGPVSGRSAGVLVEVYAVKPRQLTQLDRLEDYRPRAPEKGLYRRQRYPTRHGHAWVYRFNWPVKGRPLIRSGRW